VDHVCGELTRSSLGKQTVRRFVSAAAPAIHFDAGVALLKSRAQPVDVVRVQVDVPDHLPFLLRSRKQPLLPLSLDPFPFPS